MTKKQLVEALSKFNDDDRVVFKFGQEAVMNLHAQLVAQGHSPICWLDEVEEILPGDKSDARANEVVVVFI